MWDMNKKAVVCDTGRPVAAVSAPAELAASVTGTNQSNSHIYQIQLDEYTNCAQ